MGHVAWPCVSCVSCHVMSCHASGSCFWSGPGRQHSLITAHGISPSWQLYYCNTPLPTNAAWFVWALTSELSIQRQVALCMGIMGSSRERRAVVRSWTAFKSAPLACHMVRAGRVSPRRGLRSSRQLPSSAEQRCRRRSGRACKQIIAWCTHAWCGGRQRKWAASDTCIWRAAQAGIKLMVLGPLECIHPSLP